MNQLFKSEFYKLIRQKSFWGLTVFSCLLSSILLLDGSFPTDAQAFFDHALYALPLLYVLIMVFGALFVGKDFDIRTIQAYVCAGHKRGNILLAKATVHLVGSAAILFFAADSSHSHRIHPVWNTRQRHNTDFNEICHDFLDHLCHGHAALYFCVSF